ncbi:MAG: caspase family protein [Prevotella sp.]|nr:caspase family protein [Prevotella sp.]MBR6264116.1 caspase family protein [Prevotella sp.]
MKRKLFVAMMLLMTVSLHAHYYVVCVGISDYSGRLRNLRVSANDALTIQKIYVANGHADVRCLTDKDATVENVKRAMNQTFSKAKSDDVVIFFFSGHGNSHGYCCYDQTLFYYEVTMALMNCKAKNKVVMADACLAGNMRTSGVEEDANGKKVKNVMFFLSSRSGESSLESRYANSMFTIYLERGLRGGADTNLDKKLTAKEMYDFVHNGVIEMSRGEQHPVMWGNFNKNMVLIKW